MRCSKFIEPRGNWAGRQLRTVATKHNKRTTAPAPLPVSLGSSYISFPRSPTGEAQDPRFALSAAMSRRFEPLPLPQPLEGCSRREDPVWVIVISDPETNVTFGWARCSLSWHAPKSASFRFRFLSFTNDVQLSPRNDMTNYLFTRTEQRCFENEVFKDSKLMKCVKGIHSYKETDLNLFIEGFLKRNVYIHGFFISSSNFLAK